MIVIQFAFGLTLLGLFILAGYALANHLAHRATLSVRSVRVIAAGFSFTSKGVFVMAEMNDNQHYTGQVKFNGRYQAGTVEFSTDPTGIATIGPDPADPSDETKFEIRSSDQLGATQVIARVDADPSEAVTELTVIESLAVIPRNATAGQFINSPAVDN